MGQHFHYVGSPNRYGLPPFYELHVWAWRENVNGMFVDWNPGVSCGVLARRPGPRRSRSSLIQSSPNHGDRLPFPFSVAIASQSEDR